MSDETVVCYRMHTGDPSRSWSWMDGKPTAAMLRLAQDHGYRIEYGYSAPQTIPTAPESLDAWRKAMRCTNPRYELTEAGRAVLEGEG